MSQFDLLALDLDETLLDGDRRIPSACIDAIRECRAFGVQVVLASGRMLRSIRPFAEQLGLEGPIISYNGAYIAEALRGGCLAHNPVSLGDAIPLIGELKKLGLHINVYLDDELFVEEFTPAAAAYCEKSGISAQTQPFENVLTKDPTKILAIGAPDVLDLIQPGLAARFPGLFVTKSHPTYLEFMRSGVNKGFALEQTARHLGIPRHRIAAVGDAPNDLEMIRYAGLGVAVANAADEVRSQALIVAPSNRDGGVAWVIDRYILANGQIMERPAL